jgi:hypothetical protein
MINPQIPHLQILGFPAVSKSPDVGCDDRSKQSVVSTFGISLSMEYASISQPRKPPEGIVGKGSCDLLMID